MAMKQNVLFLSRPGQPRGVNRSEPYPLSYLLLDSDKSGYWPVADSNVILDNRFESKIWHTRTGNGNGCIRIYINSLIYI
jgi:hypothetical protein